MGGQSDDSSSEGIKDDDVFVMLSLTLIHRGIERDEVADDKRGQDGGNEPVEEDGPKRASLKGSERRVHQCR